MIRLFLNVCKTFREMKHINLNEYELYRLLSTGSSAVDFSCSACRAPKDMTVHNGSYCRHLVYLDKDCVRDRLIEVKSVKCTSCNTTHALLYSILVPHCSYGIHFLVSLIYSRLTGRFKNVAGLCAFFDLSEITFYRIWNRFLTDSYALCALLNTFSDILEAVRSLFASDTLSFHAALQAFFKSCGYSFLQPFITFRKRTDSHAPCHGTIR